ncbi:MAG: glycosyltransferase family 87 protein [Planctomycetota bacterium]|nr:glycosyltransferase family 87 protein [Planctomycetota bacterium]
MPRRVALALAVLLSVLALVQAVHKARKGQCALLKWRPQVDALARGENVYGREEGGTREGFPTLPTTALALRPFLAFGDVTAGVLWAAFKLALAWWMVLACCRMAAGNVESFPPWALLVVIGLIARVLLSDIAHGNVNIPVAACVVAAGRNWQLGREREAGWLAGLAAVLKVTPALFLAYFAWKRSPRAFVHGLIGIAVAGIGLPMLVLGPAATFELLGAWWAQMVQPFVEGAPLTKVQTEQINQSLLGVLARWFSDSVAIVARPPLFPEDVSIHVVALSPGALRGLFYVVALLLAGCAAWAGRVPRERRATADTLGELALLVLLMLFLSERSWKQHYVTLCVPVVFLAFHAFHHGWRSRLGRVAGLALAASAILHGLTGSGVLGERGSDYAEAAGVWLFGGLALFVACALLLRDRARLGPSPG